MTAVLAGCCATKQLFAPQQADADGRLGCDLSRTYSVARHVAQHRQGWRSAVPTRIHLGTVWCGKLTDSNQTKGMSKGNLRLPVYDLHDLL